MPIEEKLETTDNKTEKAGFFIRLQAQIIDVLIFFLIYTFPVFIFLNSNPNLETFLPALGISLFLIAFIPPVLSSIYHILMINKFGASLGKLFSGIKVIYEDGKLLSIKQSAFRYLVGNFVSSLLFGAGFFWVLKDKNRQGWHDQISGTFVIYFKKRFCFIGTIILLLLIVINGFLLTNTVQSIKENKRLQDEVIIIIEEVKQTLENDQAPATIEPQQPPLII